MRAILLAAGLGSRLGHHTSDKPKALLTLHGEPLLGHLLKQLMGLGIQDIVICVGYHQELIKTYCQTTFPQLSIQFVENPDYVSTNNLYSLYLAKAYLEGDIFVLNADLHLENDILKKIYDFPKSCIGVDTKTYTDEAMKVSVKDGKITEISKTIPKAHAFGSSIDCYKFLAKDVPLIKETTLKLIETHRMHGHWTEMMMDIVIKSGQISVFPCTVDGYKWIEIDTERELKQAEMLFVPPLTLIQKKELFLFDGDGTLYLGQTAIQGASETIRALKKAGKRVALCTNNSSKTPSYYVEKMANLQLPFTEEEILISSHPTMSYLKENGFKKIYLMASETVKAWFAKEGFLHSDTEPEAVVLTYDTELTYKKLVEVTHYVRAGLPYFATHPDWVCPTESGPIPDIGTFIQAIEAATHRNPDMIFGKPNVAFLHYACEKFECDEAAVLMIGDRLYTDIQMTQGTSAHNVLVLSGETTESMYAQSSIRADIVLPSVQDLRF